MRAVLASANSIIAIKTCYGNIFGLDHSIPAISGKLLPVCNQIYLSCFHSNPPSLYPPFPPLSPGMDAFRHGDVQGSIEYFDEALALGGAAIEPYLWQRGLSLYYAGKYKEGADQFRA